MHADVRIAAVEEAQTRSGHTRFVVTDDSGNEYTTFREQIGAAAKAAEGRHARIEYHETQRNGFTNVYLDKVEPAPNPHAATDRHIGVLAARPQASSSPSRMSSATRSLKGFSRS